MALRPWMANEGTPTWRSSMLTHPEIKESTLGRRRTFNTRMPRGLYHEFAALLLEYVYFLNLSAIFVISAFGKSIYTSSLPWISSLERHHCLTIFVNTGPYGKDVQT